MIGLLKYGKGQRFFRIEKLQGSMGMIARTSTSARLLTF
jgi:hypothetical protein